MQISIDAIVDYFYIRYINQQRILHKIKKGSNIDATKKISVAISTNSGFLTQTKVMVASLENAGCLVNLYILNISLTDTEISSISDIAPANVHVHEVKINPTDLEKLKISGKWPVEAWTRILIPDLISDEIVIYLDVDNIVLNSLYELVEHYSENMIAGVLSTYYFTANKNEVMPHGVNSGVLVLNRKQLLNKDFVSRIITYAKEHADEIIMPDQDSINYVCRDEMENISPKYNAMNYFFANTFKSLSRMTVDGYYTQEEFDVAKKNPTIIHYNGGPFARPWKKKGIKHPYGRIYEHYLSKISCDTSTNKLKR